MIQHDTHGRDSYQIDGELWTRGRNAIAFVALVASEILARRTAKRLVPA